MPVIEDSCWTRAIVLPLDWSSAMESVRQAT